MAQAHVPRRHRRHGLGRTRLHPAIHPPRQHGLETFAGICLGLAFHFAGRLFGFTSQLYGVPAFAAAMLPTAAFAAWAVWLIRKQERR
ncbi:hypothetical protein NEIELOOT_02002 [Neisseria elongata subsp. glycolytica ATCC 29315]|uniref:Uncharacterized protein n=1 Tax=Neisseria elongata subsp. glycolytica ATCC 29315 TaxID=546263 RepID=D4DSF7_NEIEG|nr:hypothetical protein NEIELOOT_02002 [Neisseria elongata subsp. glycolytica ATCC 29315]